MYIEERFEVAAPPRRVWDVTVALADWPRWNPTVERVELLDEGPVRPGFRARLKQPENRPAIWTVTRVEEERTFAWETRAVGMRVLALHLFEPTPTGTRVTLAIDIRGWTTPLLGWIVAGVSRRFLPQEAAGLRRECEGA